MSVKTNIEMIQILNLITNKTLSPNQFYLLYCLHKNIAPSQINIAQELRSLENYKWIVEDIGNNVNPYKLLSKAHDVIHEVELLFNDGNRIPKVIISKTTHGENIKKYNEIFPNEKLPSGKYARSSEKNLESAFKWFFENYKYSWETVIAATIAYVNEYELNSPRYLYMQTSQYFIRKQQTDKSWQSELANRCYALETGATTDRENHFKDKVV